MGGIRAFAADKDREWAFQKCDGGNQRGIGGTQAEIGFEGVHDLGRQCVVVVNDHKGMRLAEVKGENRVQVRYAMLL